jgi:hypothetical protein
VIRAVFLDFVIFSLQPRYRSPGEKTSRVVKEDRLPLLKAIRSKARPSVQHLKRLGKRCEDQSLKPQATTPQVLRAQIRAFP